VETNILVYYWERRGLFPWKGCGCGKRMFEASTKDEKLEPFPVI
jgi:hypothetical protein